MELPADVYRHMFKISGCYRSVEALACTCRNLSVLGDEIRAPFQEIPRDSHHNSHGFYTRSSGGKLVRYGNVFGAINQWSAITYGQVYICQKNPYTLLEIEWYVSGEINVAIISEGDCLLDAVIGDCVEYHLPEAEPYQERFLTIIDILTRRADDDVYETFLAIARLFY